jgi:Holliday junction resolvasome RuvABC endonuclease subunit
MGARMKILGIDPGSQVTGFGLIKVKPDGSMMHL